jgi:anaerobic selenocysteine-containing dehydrogenase
VLPPTVWGEQVGTTTNLEGRVLRLARKVTADGSAMESWRIAGELAARLGADFDLETTDEVQDEIAKVAPAFAGVDASLLRRARDGVVLPLADHVGEVTFAPAAPGAGVSWEPIRPHAADAPSGGADQADALEAGAPAADAEAAATPGEDPGAHEPVEGAPAAPAAPPSPPVALHTWAPAASAPVAVPVDAYSLRLVAGRTLYGSDAIVVASPALAGLADDQARLLVNPRDRDRIGVADGDNVRVSSTRATLDLPILADRATPVGVAFLAVNRSGPGASDLIDVSSPVTDLRVETLGAPASSPGGGA